MPQATSMQDETREADGVARYVSQEGPQGCRFITEGFGRIARNLRAVV
jgi:hypothetical protein